MHTLWSDGDAVPEIPIAWYRENGWHFVCLTDHNVLMEGERYRPILEDGHPSQEHVDQLRAQFGDSWVEVTEIAGRRRLRLKTYNELKAHFEREGEFILINGEEITTISGNPHVNVLNSVEKIGGKVSGELVPTTRTYLEAIEEQKARSGQPMLTIMNHPSFSDAVSIEEMLQLPEFRFFEVYNGHPAVNNWGHEKNGYPSTDRFWDVILSMRLLNDPDNLLLGVAADDAHNYHEWRRGRANPGRGWVMVKADSLDVERLFSAMEAGDFYASTGVMLDNVKREPAGLSFDIISEPGVSYTTRFVGTRRGFPTESTMYVNEDGEVPPRASRIYSEEIGAVLLETDSMSPEYRFSGDELYVRAIVISDKIQANPFKEGDVEMAWVQPVLTE